LAQHGEEIGLAVSVREKRHAPPFVNFFTELTNRGEDIDFNLGARATFLDLTSYGSELRVEGGIGSAMGLGGELFQPVGGRGLFAAVRGSHFRINENLYADDQLVGVFRRKRSAVGGDLGWLFAAGQLRVGYETAHTSVDPRVGLPPAEAPSGREQVLRALAVADTRDAAYFPRTGLRLDAAMDWYLEAVGTEESFGRLKASLGIPFPVGTWNRGLMRAEADTLLGPDTPLVYAPSLGGPFRLSAFGIEAFRGRHALLGQLGYLQSLAKLPDPLGDRLFAVGLFEVGSVFDDFEEIPVKFSATAGLAFDSYFGPVFLGASVGNGGSTRLFFTFGTLIH
jgi:NTE family protein